MGGSMPFISLLDNYQSLGGTKPPCHPSPCAPSADQVINDPSM